MCYLSTKDQTKLTWAVLNYVLSYLKEKNIENDNSFTLLKLGGLKIIL